jgi:hypothetical protein
MRATRRDEFPEIGAAHILALELFAQVRAAFHPEDARSSDWIWQHGLVASERQRYIDVALAAILQCKPRSKPAMVIPFRDEQEGR